MMLLVTHSQQTLDAYQHPHLGRLVQPRSYERATDTARAGHCWAADNDAFNGFGAAEETRFVKMIDTLAGLPGCRFVCVPDVVGEAGLTDLLYDEWAPQIMARGLPVAYVTQDPGVEYEPRGIPWSTMSALFIGGTTEYKLSPFAAGLAGEAKRRGLWVHMGRVNSAKRIAYAASIGVDSVDGTQWVRWLDRHLPTGLALVQAAHTGPSSSSSSSHTLNA